MFRAALASAGAHEKAPRRKVQALLHQKCPQIVVRPAGNRRLHLGSLLKMQSGRLEQLTAADALSASESRNAPSPRLSRPRHRNTQSAPFRTRQSLQHRVPQQHPVKCEQKETKLKESSHRKRWLLLLLAKMLNQKLLREAFLLKDSPRIVCNKPQIKLSLQKKHCYYCIYAKE